MSGRFHLIVVGGMLGLGAAAFADEATWELLRPGNTGIPGDYTQIIHIGEDDRPWIAAYTPFWEEGGMAVPDGDRWETISSVEHPVIASPRFNDIVVDDGIMWIGSDHGLLRFDMAAGPESMTRFDRASSPLPGNQIIGLDVSADGSIWMAVREIGFSYGGLVRLDPEDMTWQVWTTTTPEPLPWATRWPGWDGVDYVAITPENGETVWFGSELRGLASLSDGVFSWSDASDPPPGTYPISLNAQNVVDESGSIWMGTNDGLALRATDGSFTIVGYPEGLDSEVSRVATLSGGRAVLGTFYADVFIWDGTWQYIGNWGSGKHTYALAEDSTGAIWAGGIGGASKWTLESGWQRHRLTNSGMIGYSIHTIAFSANGDVVMNGNAGPGVGGFDIFHGDRWTNANDATYGIGLPWGQPSDDCSAVAVRANGNILFSPRYQGVLEYDGTQYTRVIPEYYNTSVIVEDSLGRVWGGRGNGVDLVDEEGNLTSFFGGSMPGGSVEEILVDPDNPGFVWIAARFGLVHTDGVTWDSHPRENFGLYLDTFGHHVTCAARAADGSLWVGSGLGLMHYDPIERTYVRYDEDSAPLPSEEFHNITVAPDGSVWASMFDHVAPYPGGVAHFVDDTWTIYQASSSPLPHNQVEVMRSRSVDGGYEVWIGTASEAVAVVTVASGLPEDLDGDGVVGFGDLLIVLGAWGTSGPGDVDGDGVVGFADLLLVLAAWT